jgi:hypothetical protein
MKTTTPGSSSQRAAYAAASNCFKTGGGYPSLLSFFSFFILRFLEINMNFYLDVICFFYL